MEGISRKVGIGFKTDHMRYRVGEGGVGGGIIRSESNSGGT